MVYQKSLARATKMLQVPRCYDTAAPGAASPWPRSSHGHIHTVSPAEGAQKATTGCLTSPGCLLLILPGRKASGCRGRWWWKSLAAQECIKEEKKRPREFLRKKCPRQCLPHGWVTGCWGSTGWQGVRGTCCCDAQDLIQDSLPLHKPILRKGPQQSKAGGCKKIYHSPGQRLFLFFCSSVWPHSLSYHPKPPDPAAGLWDRQYQDRQGTQSYRDRPNH